MGENLLRSIMKRMTEASNNPGKKTNCSARKATFTRLVHNDIAPTTIQQLTGYKNVQSIYKYGIASDQQQREM